MDAYGVGSSLLRGQNDFTADVVRVDGHPLAKAGRQERPNPRLQLVELGAQIPDAPVRPLQLSRAGRALVHTRAARR